MVENLEKTVYVVGYQPIHIVSKTFQVVDLLSKHLDAGTHTRTLLHQVADDINNLKLGSEQYILLNTAHNMELIQRCMRTNVLVYDPSLFPAEKEINYIFKALSSRFGSNQTTKCYLADIPKYQQLTTLAKGKVPADIYFNALTTLSDINMNDYESFSSHLNSSAAAYKQPDEVPAKRAVFVGDPVHPDFFKQLEQDGVYVSAYFPYEFFITPIDHAVSECMNNPYYDRTLTFLYSAIMQEITGKESFGATMVIFNPGGLYLTKAEAVVLAEKVYGTTSVYMLNGDYNATKINT